MSQILQERITVDSHKGNHRQREQGHRHNNDPDRGRHRNPHQLRIAYQNHKENSFDGIACLHHAAEEFTGIRVIGRDRVNVTVFLFFHTAALFFVVRLNSDVRNVLYGVKRITETESIQDSPVNVDNEIKVNFYFDEENCSTLFVYKKNFKYYIEQPYNGIYRISADEYNAIEKYIGNANEKGNSTSSYIPNGMEVADENDIGTPANTQNFNRTPDNVTIEVCFRGF